MSLHRGGLGEPYCSESCYNAAGKDIALANLHGYDGPCGFCQSTVRLKPGSGNSAHPFRKIFLYVCPGCRSRAEAHAAKIRECCFCGGGLPSRNSQMSDETFDKCPHCGATTQAGGRQLNVFRCACGQVYCDNCSGGGLIDLPRCPESVYHEELKKVGVVRS